MKNNFNTDDIDIDIDIDNLRNEFKKYIKCGLTVNEAIKKFNDNNCFLISSFEAYRSLCGTIELKYVRYIGSITDDQEIESIRKDTKLKELYKKKEECDKQISDLTIEMIKINDEINKAEDNK